MNEMTNRNSIVALFDDAASARLAQSELTAKGIAPGSVRLVEGGSGGTGESRGEKRRPGFFARLFGLEDYDDSDTNYRAYNERFANVDYEDKHLLIIEAAGLSRSEIDDIVVRNGGRVEEDVSSFYGERRGATAEDSQRVVLHEEELGVTKERVPAGEVVVRKEVVTENKTIEVPVTHEEVVIERRDVSGREGAVAAQDLREGEEIRVPVSEERVDVEKRVVAREEVEVGKRPVEETQKVSDTLRREEARVESKGKVSVRDKTTAAPRTPRDMPEERPSP